MKRLFAIFACLICILFLIFSPSIIAGGVYKDVYTERAKQKQNLYQGSITLWHIVTFPTPETGGVTYLTERASAFERQHPYVYIEVIGMTPEEAAQRKASGESPDILSFPLGYPIDPASLLSLEPNENIESVFQGCTSIGSKVYAYPYMADAYVLMVNEDSIAEGDVSLPASDAIDQETLQQLLDQNKLAISNLTYSEPVRALSSVLEEQDLPSHPLSGTEYFLDGSAPLCLCTYGEYAEISDTPENSFLDISIYTIGPYTDLVQLIGVSTSENREKEAMCASFAAFLLTATSQRKLETTGMLPSRNVSEGFSSPNYSMFSYLYQEAEIPSAFFNAG